jgi:sugar phosphate isomerase/epimerase
MPVRFSMCNEFCQGWDFADACRLAADAGYAGIEIAPFTISDSVETVTASQRASLRAAALTAGLETVGLHWLLVKPTGLYINHPDAALRTRTADYLRAEIDFCADLGGNRMIVGSPKQRDVLPSDTYQATWDRTVAVFKQLAPYAASHGVCLCIEPLAPTETNFLNKAEDARRLVREVGHPAFQMMLDVKAMCGDVEPIPDIIRKSAPYLRHFHANDANRGGPGSGSTDYRPIAAALKEVGYDGWVSVEVFEFSPGPEKIARDSIRYLREVFSA